MGICIPGFIVQWKKFIKESIICNKVKKQYVKMFYIGFITFVKIIFLIKEDWFFDFLKNGHTFNSSQQYFFFQKNASFFQNWSSFCEKRK